MRDTLNVIAGTGVDQKVYKSRVPAWLDLLQSASGLLLVGFLWLHMFFVASILLGKKAMYVVARFFEGYYFFGKSYPIIISILVAVICAIFILHAALAMRKFPSNYRQYRTFREHKNMLQHTDTNLWFVQVYTGFAMFFLGSVHLYIMLTQSDQIGPYASADRVWSEWMWPLYLLLLLAVEFHGAIGLYRLAVKWGWFEGQDAGKARARLKRVKWGITLFFLTLGLLTLVAYIKIGIEHQDRAGERYRPVAMQADTINPGTGPVT
ncbi:MAG: fumarate reductase cytochrome b subunit [Gammaproteobacteria bacterium]|nr:fumarate reductase cytochrome b subunit [Gammaproteobacteria bacterium]